MSALADMDLVVLDVSTTAPTLATAIHAQLPHLPMLAIVSADDVATASLAMAAGASGCVAWPCDAETLAASADRCIRRAARRSAAALRADLPLVGVSVALERLRAQIAHIATADAPSVLITGESGTGKDVVANAIHASGRRADRPFIAVDCASIPETLFESTLFGHERGAFTDAKTQRRGLLELASGGVVFFDEIGELPLSVQAKLLRALENRRFRRVGGSADLELDAAVVAATNRDLRAASDDGSFRSDLFFRLNVVRLHLVPLRERPEDIAPIARHFVKTLNARLDRTFEDVDPFAIGALERYAWPGNARELRNAIERAMVLNPGGDRVEIADLPPEVLEAVGQPPLAVAPSHAALPENGIALDTWERELVRQAMTRADGNQTRAAQLLGISRFAMRHRLERHDLLHLARGTAKTPNGDTAPAAAASTAERD